MKKIIYFLPRILSILFVLFLSLFALDVFSEYHGWEVVIALFMHLVPSFVLLFFVWISWRYDLFGAVIFFAAAVFYILMVGFDRHWSWYIGISGPAFLVSILYLLSWIQKKKSS